jgi:hypothetical protein
LIARIAGSDLAQRFPDLIASDAEIWSGEGWRPLVEDSLASLRYLPVVVTSVREHCAGLRLGVQPRDAWTDAAMEAADRIIAAARTRSRETCEACGAPGRPRVPGPGVRCDAHAADR